MSASSPDRPFATPADCAACRHSIRQGSRSFHLASRLMPAAARESAYAVYAFCRMADDMVDKGELDGAAAIATIREALDRIYAQRPADTFVERAFADVVRDFAIPRAVPEALVEGLEWDVQGRPFETLSDLIGYAVRVAGTVGVMMTLIMGRREPDVLARACDLGVAMQLTNICRDVGEDAANGRVYLPLSMLRRAGVPPASLPMLEAETPSLRVVIDALLAQAELLYERSKPGIARLPAGSRAGIAAALVLYREIGRIVGDGLDPFAQRAVVPTARKLELLGQAAGMSFARGAPIDAPALDEARFLLQAVEGWRRPPSRQPLPAWWDVAGRAERMVDLLARFGRRSGAAG